MLARRAVLLLTVLLSASTVLAQVPDAIFDGITRRDIGPVFMSGRITDLAVYEADPTVIYALQKAGKYTGNLRREDLQFDSPYNTYRYPGLPPGPIAAPGKASLEAAAKPADVDYLYFVSKNDGSHVFASTLAEHNRNVFTWQVDYFRKQRAR